MQGVTHCNGTHSMRARDSLQWHARNVENAWINAIFLTIPETAVYIYWQCHCRYTSTRGFRRHQGRHAPQNQRIVCACVRACKCVSIAVMSVAIICWLSCFHVAILCPLLQYIHAHAFCVFRKTLVFLRLFKKIWHLKPCKSSSKTLSRLHCLSTADVFFIDLDDSYEKSPRRFRIIAADLNVCCLCEDGRAAEQSLFAVWRHHWQVQGLQGYVLCPVVLFFFGVTRHNSAWLIGFINSLLVSTCLLHL